MKVYIADDHELCTLGLTSLLEKYINVELVFCAKDGLELLEKLEVSQPDIILMDFMQSEMNSVEISKAIKSKYRDIKIIIFSHVDDDELTLELLKIGVNGFQSKTADISELEETIRKVNSVGYYYNKHVTTILERKLAADTTDSREIKKSEESEISIFSDRENEIFQLICKEYTNSEIAEELFLSPRTIEGYRQKLLVKVGAKNTAGLIYKALSNGLVNNSASRAIA